MGFTSSMKKEKYGVMEDINLELLGLGQVKTVTSKIA